MIPETELVRVVAPVTEVEPRMLNCELTSFVISSFWARPGVGLALITLSGA